MSLSKHNWESLTQRNDFDKELKASLSAEEDILSPCGAQSPLNELSFEAGEGVEVLPELPRPLTQYVIPNMTLRLMGSPFDRDPHEEMKVRIHSRLIAAMADMDSMTSDPAILRSRIRDAVDFVLQADGKHASQELHDTLCDEIMADTMGYGPLAPLLRDRTINDILVNGPDLVFVERFGKLEETDLRFKDDAHLMQIIERIVAAVGRRVDNEQPVCDARLEDGSRFHCVIPPLALDGPLVSIRKFSAVPYNIDDLIRFGSLSQQAADLLRGFVEARLNVVISGGTGAGKTTLLNVLSNFIPGRERIVTIEDAAELQLQQKHVARMETRTPDLNGRGEVTQRELFRNALRMRPDRIILGECRAGECLDMLQAMNTGHDGSLTTLHANTPRDALRRMETMVLMSGYDLPQRAIREQIASAVNIIIQVTRLNDGSRHIVKISEVVGMEGDVVLLHDVFTFKQHGIHKDGKIDGSLIYMGGRPRFVDAFINAGISLDLNLLNAAGEA